MSNYPFNTYSIVQLFREIHITLDLKEVTAFARHSSCASHNASAEQITFMCASFSDESDVIFCLL